MRQSIGLWWCGVLTTLLASGCVRSEQKRTSEAPWWSEKSGPAQPAGDIGRLHLRECTDRASGLCTMRALSLWNGTGIPQHPVKARVLLEKACGAGNTDACAHLGRFYNQGIGVERDVTMARTLFLKACRSGSERHQTTAACASLTALHYEGAGEESDLDVARRFFEGFCERSHVKNAYICHELGRLYAIGDESEN